SKNVSGKTIENLTTDDKKNEFTKLINTISDLLLGINDYQKLTPAQRQQLSQDQNLQIDQANAKVNDIILNFVKISKNTSLLNDIINLDEVSALLKNLPNLAKNNIPQFND